VDPVAVTSPTPVLAWFALVAGAVVVLAWARPGGRTPYSSVLQVAWTLLVLGLVLWDELPARVLQGLLAGVGVVASQAGLARGRRLRAAGRC
jgi:hypothetical protein